jgi:hypothetical protein
MENGKIVQRLGPFPISYYLLPITKKREWGIENRKEETENR